jgi:hypothetical protein
VDKDISEKVVASPPSDLIRQVQHKNEQQTAVRARAKAIAKLGPEKRWASIQSDEVDPWENLLPCKPAM